MAESYGVGDFMEHNSGEAVAEKSHRILELRRVDDRPCRTAQAGYSGARWHARVECSKVGFPDRKSICRRFDELVSAFARDNVEQRPDNSLFLFCNLVEEDFAG
jgi:hypothetical protein